ncbi:LysR family transcriptional regulator [Acinetobacter guillouiae]|uniref:LysR family transcriptional regulator n=1 Tax=Acinetobacter guillouiae TaxID=106649 RepID=UPI002FDB232A
MLKLFKRSKNLNSYKFFYYAAIYESATIASKKLKVTQSAVSRQIKSLEDNLNLTLFIRNGKQLELTPEGVKLLSCCQNIFHEIDKSLIQLNKRDEYLDDLVISCEATLCMKWLIPRLKNFENINNTFKIKIKIISENRLIDFNKTDIVISRENLHFKEHIHSIKLVNEIMFFIQKPSYVGKNILISSSRPKLWRNLLKIEKIRKKISDLTYIELDQFYLCIEACLSGLGSTIVSGYMIEKELKNKLLKPIITPILDDSSYYLSSTFPFEEDFRKTIFKNWLIGEFEKSKIYLENYYI